MKKIINRTLALVFATVALTSCLKDDSTILDPNKAGANSLNKTDKRNPVNNPAIAAAPVVLFQNIPRINMAKTPGLIKPVYF